MFKKNIFLPLLPPTQNWQDNSNPAIFKRTFEAKEIYIEENDDILIDIWKKQKNKNIDTKANNLFLFEPDLLKITTQNPCIIFTKNLSFLWFTNLPPQNFAVKNIQLLPLLQINKKNIHEKAIQFFKKHYQNYWQSTLKQLKKNWNIFFNTSDWENLKVKENLAFLLKEWIFFLEKEENYKDIQKNIIKLTSNAENLWQKMVKKWKEIENKFQKWKENACIDEESKDILIHYFEKTKQSIEFLDNFWQNQTIIYDKELKTEDIFYYTLAVLMKNKKQKIENWTSIELYEDFFEYVEKGKKMAEMMQNFSKIEIKYEPKILKINSKENTFKKFKINAKEKKIEFNENLTLIEIPDIFWEFKIGNKNLAFYLEKQQKEGKKVEELFTFFKKCISFLLS